jgi:diguanylate cyclase (GGDEF)-like protein
VASSALGLEDLVAAMPHAAAVIDRSGATVVANPAWTAVASDLALLFPLPAGDVIELDAPLSLVERRPSPAEMIRAAVRGDVPEAVERLRVRSLSSRTSEPRTVEVRVVPIGVGSAYVLATCTEVPAGDAAEGGWDLIDRHPVTGLPGRRLFLELLGQAMTMSDRHRYHPAALAVGLTGLDDVELSYGADARNELAVAVASRLKAGLRPGDVVAQTGPEQFVIMLPDVDGGYLAEAVAHRLGAEVGRPFRLGDARAEIELYVGVATAEASKSPALVLSAAEAALAEARADVTPTMVNATRRVVVAGGLGDPRAAEATAGQSRRIDVADLREEELISYFQPIFDITDRRVVAGEALMRWRHPHYGVLSAGEFLGLAINSGMLATLTDQALVCSTETWADLRDRLGPRPPQLFVNLSPDQLLSRVAVDRLFHLLIATGLPPEDVVVEVTEEAMSTRFGEMLAVLTELRVHGLRVALDDFGSGYSSLGRLRHLPVDVIKVDQSMVRGLEADRRARQLLAAVNTMAVELDVECIVEGIETAGEADIVSDLGFRYVQGYHFARPCPAEDFVTLVERADADTSRI